MGDMYAINRDRLNLMEKTYYGDNDDISINKWAIADLRYVCNYCKDNDIYQPEVFPWAGGIGGNAEWITDDYHIALSTDGKDIRLCICKTNPVRAIELPVFDIYDAIRQTGNIIRVLSL